MYPNPAADEIRFELKNPNVGPVTLTIFDLKGEVRKNEEISAFSGTKTILVGTAGLKPGSYIYRVEYSGKVSVGKFEKIN